MLIRYKDIDNKYSIMSNEDLANLINFILLHDSETILKIRDALSDKLLERLTEEKGVANLNILHLSNALIALGQRDNEQTRETILNSLESQTTEYDFSRLIEKVKNKF